MGVHRHDLCLIVALASVLASCKTNNVTSISGDQGGDGGACSVETQSLPAGRVSASGTLQGLAVPAVDGYATVTSGGMNGSYYTDIAVVLTSHANACGNALAGVAYEGETRIAFQYKMQGTQPVDAGAAVYEFTSSSQMGSAQVVAFAYAGKSCATSTYYPPHSPPQDADLKLSIATLTADRLQGSFDIVWDGNRMSGTLDLPICPTPFDAVVAAESGPTDTCCP
jgi:hypothetical protein